jgi:HEPN domain-containing protein
MPHDPILIADTKAWLKKAGIDLRAARIDLDADPPLLEDMVFHCQQAVEKSFKAFLTFHDQPFRKTHNLEEIGEACLNIDSSLRDLVAEAVPLSEYAWAFRYPGDPETPDLEESKSALSVAEQINIAILQRVPKEAHPTTSHLFNSKPQAVE